MNSQNKGKINKKSQTIAATNARQTKRLRSRLVKKKNQNKLLKNQINKMLNIKANINNHRIDEYFSVQQNQQFTVTKELHDLASIKPRLRRYSTYVISIALGLLLLHPPSLDYIRNFIPFPSRQSLNNRAQTNYIFDVDLLTNISRKHDLIAKYQEKEHIKGTEEIRAILAVDALSFHKEVYIDKRGIVRGLVNDEIVNEQAMKEISDKYDEIEKFIKSRANVTISNAFVYQVQPLDPSHPSFVLHIIPSTQGKATDRELNMLGTLKQILMENSIKIVGCAMAGDSTYSALHKELFDSYYNIIIKDVDFVNYTSINLTSVISDPLHILKRIRYRCLRQNVHCGITNGTEEISIDQLKEILKLPSFVFSNEKYTKMHDRPPIQLMNFNSLCKRIRNNSKSLSYFLPFSLLNISISEQKLTHEEKFNMIEKIVKENHDYEVCEISYVEILGANKEFLDWIDSVIENK